jgi:hypothetical protein
MTRNDADAIVHLLMTEWVNNADRELKPLWKKVSPFIWKGTDNHYKCTLNWQEWDLSIVTFDIPLSIKDLDINSVPNSQHIVLIEGPLTEDGNPIIVHTQVAQTRYPGHKVLPMSAPEICDAFLAGEWTPWWTCRCCHIRKQRKIKPQ